jgi:hypothetical protein
MTDRRAFLAAAPALALLTAGPAIAGVGTAQDGGIDHAIAAYRDANERAHASAMEWAPAHDKWRALCETIPHHTTVEQREAQEAVFKQELRVDGLAAVHDRLVDLQDDAWTAVESYPVRTVADLIKKIEFIGENVDHTAEQMLADLRRIDGMASHGRQLLT